RHLCARRTAGNDCAADADWDRVREDACELATPDGFYDGYQAAAACQELPDASGSTGYSDGIYINCSYSCERYGDSAISPCEQEWRDSYKACYDVAAAEGFQAATGCE
ncbi:MAG TPA: hypothetical protein PLA94_30700, partial [Myxococcota bacterium]|nr:hypothetical protein [Myxococcota bacterium]